MHIFCVYLQVTASYFHIDSMRKTKGVDVFLVLHWLLHISGIKNAFIGLSSPCLSMVPPCALSVSSSVKRTFTGERQDA